MGGPKKRGGLRSKKGDQHRGKSQGRRDDEDSAPNEENDNGTQEIDEIEDDEIDKLRRLWAEEAPAPGTQLQKKDTPFNRMSLSQRTKEALKIAKLDFPTEIQAAAIPHALAGRDILGAAKTGSGKTLAFVIPLLELLHAERWDTDDGLAALVITPTRELALQIFEVLRLVGKKHTFSAGLVTGGKKEFDGEQARVVRMNILVATPGRLLQHLEQTPGFDASKILILVLDEADRILDMGFRTQLDSILEYLPRERQTLLFSATQTKSVKDLARLSLKDAEYLAVHAEHKEATPEQLLQNYVVCPLQEKLDILFSFIKSHLKSKIIVFMSTCSQVRFVFECIKGMQPGLPLIALHGKIKQEKRTLVFLDFARRKSACLFATDIAARGLDFPDVDWVFQLDAPEDSAMYIHRVGRTARYKSGGRALMTLMPTEERAVISKLEQSGVHLKKLSVNPKHAVSVASQAAALLVARPEFRLLAKKAFSGYLRSLQNLPSSGHQTEPVDLLKLPVDAFAASLGLAFTPPLPIANRNSSAVSSNGMSNEVVKEKKNVNRALDKLKRQIKEAKERRKALHNSASSGNHSDEEKNAISSDDESLRGEMTEEQKMIRTHGKKKARLLLKNRSLRPVVQGAEGEDSAGEEDDDLLVVKQIHNLDTISVGTATSTDDNATLEAPALMSRSQKKKLQKIRVTGEASIIDRAATKHIKFTEDGELKKLFGTLGDDSNSNEQGVEALELRVRDHMKTVKDRIDALRDIDKENERARVKEKHRKLRQEARMDRQANSRSGAVLANAVEEEMVASDNSEEVGSSEDGEGDRENVSVDSYDNSEDDGYEEEIEEEGRKANNRKRKIERNDRELDSDRKKNKKNGRQSLKEQEELALRILNAA